MERIRRFAIGVCSAAATGCWSLDDLSSYARGSASVSLDLADRDAATADVLRTDQVFTPVNVSNPDDAANTGTLEGFPDGAESPGDAGSGVAASLPGSGADGSGADGGAPACAVAGERLAPDGATCYRLPALAASWPVAQSTCESEGARLVSIGSALEDAFLTDAFGVTFWTGANDRASEGRFEWDDGEPFVFSNFDAGEPNNLFGVQDCVEKERSSGAWHDRDCNVRNRFVCERPRSARSLR